MCVCVCVRVCVCVCVCVVCLVCMLCVWYGVCVCVCVTLILTCSSTSCQPTCYSPQGDEHVRERDRHVANTSHLSPQCPVTHTHTHQRTSQTPNKTNTEHKRSTVSGLRRALSERALFHLLANLFGCSKGSISSELYQQ